MSTGPSGDWFAVGGFSLILLLTQGSPTTGPWLKANVLLSGNPCNPVLLFGGKIYQPRMTPVRQDCRALPDVRGATTWFGCGLLNRGWRRARADMEDRGGAQRRSYRAAGKPFRSFRPVVNRSDTFEAGNRLGTSTTISLGSSIGAARDTLLGKL
jgi:hypothetical protein